MSFSRSFFTSSPSAQDEALRMLARKAIEHTKAKGGSARNVFDAFIRKHLLHAKHAVGAPPEEMKEIRRRSRYVFSQEYTKSVPLSPVAVSGSMQA
jgi:hypothetical protein